MQGQNKTLQGKHKIKNKAWQMPFCFGTQVAKLKKKKKTKNC